MSQYLNRCSRQIPSHAPAKLQSNNPIKPRSKNRKYHKKSQSEPHGPYFYNTYYSTLDCINIDF